MNHQCSRVDTRVLSALCLLVFVVVLTVSMEGQTNNWRLHGYDAWRKMTVGERYGYITGVIVGSYSFGLRYMLENSSYAGKIPNPYDYMLDVYSSSELYNLVEQVYADPAYRGVTLPEIVCWPEVWIKELKLGI